MMSWAQSWDSQRGGRDLYSPVIDLLLTADKSQLPPHGSQ